MKERPFQNTLYTGDNLFILTGMNSASVDLIYLDPPFNSKGLYSAPIGSKAAGASFKDMWSWDDVNEAYLERMIGEYPVLYHYINSVGMIQGKAMMAYLAYMAQRIIEMHRVLKDTGSLYLHCDPTASHYLKIIMDLVFGGKNFRNEVVWCYTGAGSPKMRQFNRKHDIIFWYNKGAKWTFNREAVRLPYKDANQRPRRAYDTGGSFTKESIDAMRLRGKVPESWWAQEKGNGLAVVARRKSERTGYPTQKPLALLNRIIKASSNEGDVVLDPFCGCATTCVSAQHLGRKWIGIDIEKKARELVVDRLSDAGGLFSDFVHRTDIPKRTDIKEVSPEDVPIKKQLYKEQGGKCNGCENQMEERHFEVDHIVPRSAGGGNYKENYQLLCGNCNRVKGNRPMEYLLSKIRARSKVFERISYGALEEASRASIKDNPKTQ